MQKTSNPVDRRAFLKGGVLAASASAAASVWAAEPPVETPAKPAAANLREKIFGCIAGCHIGSAMAAPVEGWSWQRIEENHGLLDRLLAYQHYGNGWNREPGTTEDGVERQKLMITAILEKQDRVNAEDIRKIWVRDINPKAPGNVSEPFEGALLAIAKTPLPAADIGKYCDYAGLISLARSCHPIGLINAGDVDGAVNDVREVGQLYQTANSRGIRWAEVTMIGIAAGTKPNATVDSVLGAIFDRADKSALPEIERGLKLTADCRDVRQMRQKFDAVYSGQGVPYAFSYANEVVTKAVCVFKMVGGNTWEAMKAGVNMGRDTDCLTSVAAGISGALSGGGSIPEALVRQVDHATSLNKFTNSKRTLRETSDGLYGAFQARLKRMRAFVAEMEHA
ncbi:MAG: ADP-ribosylglycohydrolase family protein [Pirellulales bacterium]